MPIETLTQLHYSTDFRLPFSMYLYESDGFHQGPIWVCNDPMVKSDASPLEAKHRCAVHVSKGLQVRITDSQDMLLFHSEKGKVLYPEGATIDSFWKQFVGLALVEKSEREYEGEE